VTEFVDGDDRARRDRLARLLNVVSILQAHAGDGVSPIEIAKRTGTSKRTAYRDIDAIGSELHLPVWGENGRFGMEGTAFLPPLRLTLSEAMAVFLSARLVTRFMDKHDPHLASAFTKLKEALPPNLGAQVERTVQELTSRPLDDKANRHTADLTRAWAEQRVVQFTYSPAAYNGAEPAPRLARVRPYLLEPSLQTHALYLIGWDEERNAMRTFKVDRISDLSILPQTFDAPEEDVVSELRLAWDIISDQVATEVVLRFADRVADRVLEATWHPSQKVSRAADGTLEWRATVGGIIEIRLWILSWGDDVEVLAPEVLREDVAATHRRAAARYKG